MTDQEQAIIAEFLSRYFGPEFLPAPLDEADERLIDGIMAWVASQFERMRYAVGVPLDFALLAQRLAQIDPSARHARPDLTWTDIERRYERITRRGPTPANTLTLAFAGQAEGIRAIEEAVLGLFRQLDRPGYPSAYVYNTGQWQKYIADVLVPCFRLSESGRYHLCRRVIAFGLTRLAADPVVRRTVHRPRLFPAIVGEYRRPAKGENAGLVYQGIAYGFFQADRPHLNFIAEKVRAGSTRQRHIGDLDGYFGLDLEVTVEVKDLLITPKNLDRQLGRFIQRVHGHPFLGIAFVRAIEDDAQAAISAAGIHVLTQDDVLAALAIWDWPKQDLALHGLLHYLASIEQAPPAVDRLLAFIAERDPTHPSLAAAGAATPAVSPASEDEPGRDLSRP